ncbi:MAG TPA: hypothetical protein VD906_13350 [Caulobacteraceae bacterium]|nr:hypothetical protein [Caulobacteraceae bacterium]
MAQGLHADGLRPKPSVDGVETSPVQRLPKEARDWIAAERERQAARPGGLERLALDVDREMGPAIAKAAKRERMGTGDLLLFIMYDIVRGANEQLETDLRAMTQDGAQPDQMQATAERKRVLDILLAEITDLQTVYNRALLASLGPQ